MLCASDAGSIVVGFGIKPRREMHGRRRNEIRSAAFQVRMLKFTSWTDLKGPEAGA